MRVFQCVLCTGLQEQAHTLLMAVVAGIVQGRVRVKTASPINLRFKFFDLERNRFSCYGVVQNEFDYHN
jgi:hypothetical protein